MNKITIFLALLFFLFFISCKKNEQFYWYNGEIKPLSKRFYLASKIKLDTFIFDRYIHMPSEVLSLKNDTINIVVEATMENRKFPMDFGGFSKYDTLNIRTNKGNFGIIRTQFKQDLLRSDLPFIPNLTQGKLEEMKKQFNITWTTNCKMLMLGLIFHTMEKIK